MSEAVLSWNDIQHEPDARQILDHGFVYLKSVYGTDATICESARISYGKGTKSINDDRHLTRYLLRHQHTSPFEQCSATFILKLPLFVMGQLVRHRTAKLNQYSGRYSVMPEEFYVPEAWRSQSRINKQGSADITPYTPNQYGADDMDEPEMHGLSAELVAQDEYRSRISADVSREQARICLPQSQYTLCVWQCDLHNIMHFLKLRMDSHAQKEIRDYADAMYELLKPKFPIAMEAFEDYKLHAKTFSRMEMQALKMLLSSDYSYLDYTVENVRLAGEDAGLHKRELEEFVSKLTQQ